MKKPPRLLPATLAFFGFACSTGASMELVANLAPQLLPVVVRDGLESSFYNALHAEPVVAWWTRLHNVINLGAALGLLLCARLIRRGDDRANRPAQALLGWFIVSAGIGAVLLLKFVFPAMDRLAEFPVSVTTMQASMLSAPLGLSAFSLTLIVLLRRL